MSEVFGTQEQKDELLKKINQYEGEKSSSLIPILQDAQGIYGYLPIQVQKMIAEEIKVPLSNIYGVVTFYSQFYLEKKGDCEVCICLGTACYVKGAGEILETFKEKLGIDVDETTANGKFSLSASRCIGACGLAPVLTVNEDVHGRLTVADVDRLIEQYN
ncbi:MAG: NAD(P)H-dependent oxidoreductase subunit E [Lachnospirales bacterium]